MSINTLHKGDDGDDNDYGDNDDDDDNNNNNNNLSLLKMSASIKLFATPRNMPEEQNPHSN